MSLYLNGAGAEADRFLERFKLLTVMPAADVDDLENQHPGFLMAQFELWSGWLDTRLRKRYAAPFQAPYVPALEGWLASLVTLRAYIKHGIRQTDEQWPTIVEDDKTARAEVLEAAGSVTGLFDLPLRANTTADGIVKGGPLGSSDASPYAGFDRQAEDGRAQDYSRGQ